MVKNGLGNMLFWASSNNYNMKNQPARHAKTLDLLYTLNILREDCSFFSKLLLFETDKKQRTKYLSALAKLEQERIRRQSSIIASFSTTQVTESWKNALFNFSNRIYKAIKGFHHRLVNLSSKVAEISDTNLFLQQFRNSCIEQLGQSSMVDCFLEGMTKGLRKRYQQQVAIYSSSAGNKAVENIKREESSKVNRYLVVIKDWGPDLFLESHHRAFVKVDNELRKNAKEKGDSYNKSIEQLSDLMDLQEAADPTVFTCHNGMAINLNYLEEGFCEFIVAKWPRVFKQMRSKNEDNQRSMNRFRERYQQFSRKSKVLSASKIQHLTPLKEEYAPKIEGMSVEMRDFSSYFELTTPSEQANTVEKSQHCGQKPKKMSIFKINKLQSRKRSHTLRPLTDSKENKEVVHQKVIEMRLVENTPQLIKNMRIRRRKHFPVLRDENSLSVLMRDNHNPPKLALCMCIL